MCGRLIMIHVLFVVLDAFCAVTQINGQVQKTDCGPGEQCLRISQCPWIRNIFEKNLIDAEIIEIFYNRICDYGQNYEPRICCDNSLGPCITADNDAGFCATRDRCNQYSNESGLPSKQIKSTCQYGNPDKKVCCPLLRRDFPLPGECGLDGRQLKVFGGNETDIDEFPWTALIEYGDSGNVSFSCGGALINSRFVLTAAHCVRSDVQRQHGRIVRVRLGEHDISTEKDCVFTGDYEVCAKDIIRPLVHSIIVPKKYDDNTDNPYDIALIKLNEPVTFSDFVSPVCLPVNYVTELPTTFFITGWGETESGRLSNVKLKVQVPLHKHDICAEIYNQSSNLFQTITQKHICAGQVGKSACVGDSGGSLIGNKIISGYKIWYSFGVLSFGIKPCATEVPSVFVSVTEHIPWILSKIRS